LCGPMLHSSLGGSQYYISFTGWKHTTVTPFGTLLGLVL
jgi:hypothetical protein